MWCASVVPLNDASGILAMRHDLALVSRTQCSESFWRGRYAEWCCNVSWYVKCHSPFGFARLWLAGSATFNNHFFFLFFLFFFFFFLIFSLFAFLSRETGAPESGRQEREKPQERGGPGRGDGPSGEGVATERGRGEKKKKR